MKKCDPMQPHDIWLPEFDNEPAESRPVFTFRRASARQWDEISDVLDGDTAATAEGGDGKAAKQKFRDTVFSAVLLGLVGVRNQVDLETGEAVLAVSEVADVRKILNLREAFQLLSRRLKGGQLDAGEKKPSASPS